MGHSNGEAAPNGTTGEDNGWDDMIQDLELPGLGLDDANDGEDIVMMTLD